MKLLNLTCLVVSNKTFTINQHHKFNPVPSFKSSYDEFQKDTQPVMEDPIEKLRDRFKSLVKASSERTRSSDIQYENCQIEKMNKEIKNIADEYEIINQLLSNSSSKDKTNKAQVIFDYLDAMAKLGKDRGFNRISGYDEVKNELRKNFVIEKMLADKVSNVNIPNAVLFYGPPSNGKTLFAKALAEQTLSNLAIIDASKLSEEECFEKIEKEAKKAKDNYIKSGNKKTRTIIVLNEAEIISNSDSVVYEKVKDFLKNCSNEYKTTVFMTTNYPKFIDKSILSKNITPMKIAIEPADSKTAKKIVENSLIMTNKMPKEGSDKIIEALKESSRKSPSMLYSNGDITALIEAVLLETSHPTSQDFVNFIRSGSVTPSLDEETLGDFYAIKKEMETVYS